MAQQLEPASEAWHSPLRQRRKLLGRRSALWLEDKATRGA
jgi:hypothetical protein